MMGGETEGGMQSRGRDRWGSSPRILFLFVLC